MEISGLIILCLIIFASLLFIRLINRRYFPVDPPIPPPKKLIGGCEGTRFGCCPDKQTSCIDEECSNCLLDATPDLGTLENAYKTNEQNKLDLKMQNDRLNKIEQNLENLKELKETIEEEIEENEKLLENQFLEQSSKKHIERQLLFKKEELSEVNKKIQGLEDKEEKEVEELSEKAALLSMTETIFEKMFSMFFAGKVTVNTNDQGDQGDPADEPDDEPADDEPADDEPADDEPAAETARLEAEAAQQEAAAQQAEENERQRLEAAAQQAEAALCSIGNNKAFQITKTFIDGTGDNKIFKLYAINGELELHKSPPCGGTLLEFEAMCDGQVFKIKEKSSGNCFSDGGRF